MNVWIVSVGEPLPSDGANVRLRRMGNLAEYISKNANNEVHWFSVSFDHYKKSQRVEKDTDIKIHDNHTMHLVRVNGYKRNVSLARIFHHVSGARKIFSTMKKLGNKPDIIIASMEPLEMSKIAVKYGKKYNVPVVVDVRDLWPEIYFEVINKKLHFLLKPYVYSCRKTLKKTMSKATSIIGLSKDFLSYGLKYAGRKQSGLDAVIPIAYPNYNYENFKNNYNLLQNRFGLKEDDFVVVFLGNFGNQFDFEPIVDASILLANHKNIKFVLCGTGLQLEKIKKETGDNVIYPGWIEKEDIMTLTANASLGLAPYIDSMNYRMNTPNKFGEYLSASLPPVISVSGVMEELLKENNCGARYLDGETLKTIILSYYNDNKMLKEHSENARLLYERMFNADTVNEKFVEHMKKVIKGNLEKNV